MKKIYVNRKPVSGPWGGGNAWVKALYKNLTDSDVELVPADDQSTPSDIILIAGLDNDQHGISAEQAIMYKMYAVDRDVKIVLRVNENDARKDTNNVDRTWIKYSEHVDATIFVSDWLKDYFLSRGWKNKKTTVIKNGVDKEIFHPCEKFNDGKLNIVAHHWSDNYLKGFDIYDKLDEFVGKNSDKYTFTYIGRDRGTFKNTKIVKPLHGKKLGDELGRYDVYVSASRHDPGPNHVLEALSAGLPTLVHKDGGGCVEFAGGGAAYSDWADLERRLVTREFPQSHPQLSDWESCINEYRKFMRSL